MFGFEYEHSYKEGKSSKLAFLHNAGFNKKVQFDLSTFTESFQFILQSIKKGGGGGGGGDLT